MLKEELLNYQLQTLITMTPHISMVFHKESRFVVPKISSDSPIRLTLGGFNNIERYIYREDSYPPVNMLQ